MILQVQLWDSPGTILGLMCSPGTHLKLMKYGYGAHVSRVDSHVCARDSPSAALRLTRYAPGAHQACFWTHQVCFWDSPGMLLGLTRYVSGTHQVCLWGSPGMSLGCARNVERNAYEPCANVYEPCALCILAEAIALECIF